MWDYMTFVICFYSQADLKRTQGLEVTRNAGKQGEKAAGKERGYNGYEGKKNTEAELWRSMVAADSGYQQLTCSAKQPAQR